MGVSVSPMIIIGISLDNIVTPRTVTETFELHDERGQKTGQSKTETTTLYDVQTPTGVQTVDGLYTDELAEVLGVEDYPYDNTKIGLFGTTYEDPDLCDIIIGRRIVQNEDAMYGGGANSVSLDELTQHIEELNIIFHNDFKFDFRDIRLYLNSNVG